MNKRSSVSADAGLGLKLWKFWFLWFPGLLTWLLRCEHAWQDPFHGFGTFLLEDLRSLWLPRARSLSRSSRKSLRLALTSLAAWRSWLERNPNPGKRLGDPPDHKSSLEFRSPWLVALHHLLGSSCCPGLCSESGQWRPRGGLDRLLLHLSLSLLGLTEVSSSLLQTEKKWPAGLEDVLFLKCWWWWWWWLDGRPASLSNIVLWLERCCLWKGCWKSPEWWWFVKWCFVLRIWSKAGKEICHNLCLIPYFQDRKV